MDKGKGRVEQLEEIILDKEIYILFYKNKIYAERANLKQLGDAKPQFYFGR